MSEPMIDMAADHVTIRLDAVGQLDPLERLALFSAVIVSRASRAIELGTGWEGGGSTLYIIGAMMASQGHLVSVDIDPAHTEKAAAAFPGHEFVTSPALDWLEQNQDVIPFQFAFIDYDSPGGSVELCKALDLLYPLLDYGAIVAAHDWTDWRWKAFNNDSRFNLISVIGSIGTLVKVNK